MPFSLLNRLQVLDGLIKKVKTPDYFFFLWCHHLRRFDAMQASEGDASQRSISRRLRSVAKNHRRLLMFMAEFWHVLGTQGTEPDDNQLAQLMSQIGNRTPPYSAVPRQVYVLTLHDSFHVNSIRR